MPFTNLPSSLSDLWSYKARPPQSVFYELEAESAALVKKIFDGQRIPALDLKPFNLLVSQSLVFLGQSFMAAAYFPTLYKLSLGQNGPRFFAAIPVGYARDFTPPLHAREITDEKEYAHIMMGLFANGHCTPPHIDIKRPEKAELPDDFYPETSLFHLSVHDMGL